MTPEDFKRLLESPPEELREDAFACRQAAASRQQAAAVVAQIEARLREAQDRYQQHLGFEAAMQQVLERNKARYDLKNTGTTEVVEAVYEQEDPCPPAHPSSSTSEESSPPIRASGSAAAAVLTSSE